MSFLYNFGFGQEDELTQAASIQVENGSVVCIASAGDLPLSLLALGARKIIAVDISEPQLHLCHLKSAAIQSLERGDAAKFLGFAPAGAMERQRWLAQCLPLMPPEAAEFWKTHGATMYCHGPIWCGRYERFLSRLRILLQPALGHAFQELVQCSDCISQKNIFEKRINRAWLRMVFRIAFNPSVFSRRGMDPKSLAQRQSPVPLGDQYWTMLRAFCINTMAADNPWLQLFTLGRLVSPGAAPAYLTPAGFERTKQALKFLRWVKSDVLEFVHSQMPADTNKVCLSNLPDWLNGDQFEELIGALSCKLASGSRLVWCYLHVQRNLPSRLSRQIRIFEDFGACLREQDRFPFYHIVPAQIV
jgi:S-adenosylmethionine-diacylglycerol 3-amino-3-carboxypropyl transferase